MVDTTRPTTELDITPAHATRRTHVRRADRRRVRRRTRQHRDHEHADETPHAAIVATNPPRIHRRGMKTQGSLKNSGGYEQYVVSTENFAVSSRRAFGSKIAFL